MNAWIQVKTFVPMGSVGIHLEALNVIAMMALFWIQLEDFA
jgi:hypothetical protein